MSTRQSIRPRHFDNLKNVFVVQNAQALDYTENDIQQIQQLTGQPEQTLKPKGKESIPIPEVVEVQSYRIDYLPICKWPFTYIKEGKQPFRDIVDYDLDKDDISWLNQYNKDANVLSKQNFEKILQILETSNAEATDKVITAAGAQQAEKLTLAACNSIEHMSYDEAITKLQDATGIHIEILDVCYKYWRDKRLKQETPLMRKYQCPPSANDPNPFNVFRARERINKPLTRRRRENNTEFIEKLKMINQSIRHSLELTLKVLEREQMKYLKTLSNVVLQKIQIGEHHDNQISQEQQVQVKELLGRKSQMSKDIEMLIKESRQPFSFSIFPASQRVRDILNSSSEDVVAKLDPPPLPLQKPMLFTRSIRIKQLKQKLIDEYKLVMPNDLELDNFIARVGRGGRIILDRINQNQDKKFGDLNKRQFSSTTSQRLMYNTESDPRNLNQEQEWPPKCFLQTDYKGVKQQRQQSQGEDVQQQIQYKVKSNLLDNGQYQNVSTPY